LPPTCSTVYAQGVAYTSCGGIFYQPSANGGFQVVPPPIGAMVDSIPSGAQQRTSPSGAVYWTADGVNYKPFYSGSSVVYQIVSQPS